MHQLEKKLEKPLFSFGVIADCQYSNEKVPKSSLRQYELSLKKLMTCVEQFNQLELDFVVHLGDLIDQNFDSYEKILPIYNQLKTKHYHVLGNHDFHVLEDEKDQVLKVLSLKNRYYHFCTHGYRFIILDGNDRSLYAYPKIDPRTSQSAAYYSTLPKGTPTWTGGLSQEQINWLEKNLNDTQQTGEKVIVFCHFPIVPESVHNLWNAEEVLEMLTCYSNVIAYMNGQNHNGAYTKVSDQHYLTFKGMVDTDETAFAVLHVYENRIEVKGVGRQEDKTLRIPKVRKKEEG